MDASVPTTSATPPTASAYQPTTNHFFFGLNNQSYYPGKPVDGVVVAVIQKTILVHRIGIHWKGHEHVSWFQGVGQNEQRYAQNTLVESDFVIWPDSPEQGPKEYQPGTYTFHFSWKNLPKDLPANFEEKENTAGNMLPFVFSTGMLPRTFGEIPSYIRYGATGYLDFTVPDAQTALATSTATPTKADAPTPSTPSSTETPPSSSSTSTSTTTPAKPKLMRLQKAYPFKVSENFDKNIIIQPPILAKETRQLMYGGSIAINLSVANGGVLFSGQNIYVNLAVDNSSNRIIDTIKMHLVELVVFSAPNPTLPRNSTFERRLDVLHAAVSSVKIQPNSKFQNDLTFIVPAGTPASISRSKHISRKYFLEVRIEVSFAQPIVAAAPITLLEWSPLLKDDLPTQVPINLTASTTTPPSPSASSLTTTPSTPSSASSSTQAASAPTGASPTQITGESGGKTKTRRTSEAGINYDEDSSEEI